MQQALIAIAFIVASMTGAMPKDDGKLKVGMGGPLFPLIRLGGVIKLDVEEQCGNYFIIKPIPVEEGEPPSESLTFYFRKRFDYDGDPVLAPVTITSRFVVPYVVVPKEGEELPIFRITRLIPIGPVELVRIYLSQEELDLSPCLQIIKKK